ncbi:Ig-like domain-containing protein [Streptomyces sp. H27-H1]|uniref:L,D-transpeptidase n=1 Tax=Streptomyces sp. H27-H1 TaxID=2996461 RepID=UPI002270AEC8|nr:Ig-like domain-containing protein [Streptomyces sp. H27-H1]MCY0928800.1 Ig-like domain-containing protein [Streptomyces sp. H27-H1]
MSRTRRVFSVRSRTAVAAGTALLAASLAACGGGAASGGTAKSEMKQKPDMAVSVNLTGDQVKAGRPVTVTIADGKLATVKVTDAKGGELAGQISADGKTWTSQANALPSADYKVEAQNTDSQSATTAFKTSAPDQVNKVSINIPKGSTVGVAMPVSIVFDNPVKDKAAVEKQLKVTTSDNTVGSWGWIKDYSGKDRVDWRPKEYWKSGTDVKVQMNLNGVDSGPGGGMFVKDYNTEFKIGKDRRVKVDLDSKRMTVTENGQSVGTTAISAGTPGGKKASWDGKMVMMAKEGTIRMDSQTVGLGDSYDKMVEYSIRLTWSGMYVHAAPWNTANFGRANTSSGCVGMSDEEAKAFFAASQAGDPFEVAGQGSKGNPDIGNGYGEWNLTWEQWQAKSAAAGAPQTG